MPAFTASAPGKVILFGEHAVVYGQPAIAVPLLSTRARATVIPDVQGSTGEIVIDAPQLPLTSPLLDLGQNHPLRAAVEQAAGEIDLSGLPACKIQINSDVPAASGLGSSAAVSTALIRSFSAFLGQRLTDQELSDKVFEVEKIQHGTPSGIDNTVVSFQRPIFFQIDTPIEFLSIPKPFRIIIADSGIQGNTRLAVQGVRDKWQREPEQYRKVFDEIGDLCRNARTQILGGNPDQLGALMDRNQALLEELGVSTPELESLIQAAREAGALGAKLSGGGLGGHVIALVNEGADQICQHLTDKGAVNAYITPVEERNPDS